MSFFRRRKKKNKLLYLAQLWKPFGAGLPLQAVVRPTDDELVQGSDMSEELRRHWALQHAPIQCCSSKASEVLQHYGTPLVSVDIAPPFAL